VHLQKLQIINFRNYEEATFDLQPHVVCLIGPNGCGKTNFLDAIHYLSFTKGAGPATDAQSVRKTENWFLIKGWFARAGGVQEVACSFQALKKTVRENDVEYGRLSEHVGKYPVVMISPQDIELIWDGSEVRRRFFDSLLCQLDRTYLQHLIAYSGALKQRNAALQLFAQRDTTDFELLAQYTRQLVTTGTYLHQAREKLVRNLALHCTVHYQSLSQKPDEIVSIRYRSEAHECALADLFERSLERDRAVQRTTAGIHRDDFVFELAGQELKRFGSQGQQKSFLIALKMAEFETLATAKGFKPLLLLDDIFDKLDDQRMERLMQAVAQETFGQIFVTDARPDRSRQITAALSYTPQFIDFRSTQFPRQR
jgi:DNA replication and repair protein RecF